MAAAVGQPLRHGRPLFLTFMVRPIATEGGAPCAAFRPFCGRRAPRPPHALTRRCRGVWYLCGMHAQTLGARTLFAGEGPWGATYLSAMRSVTVSSLVTVSVFVTVSSLVLVSRCRAQLRDVRNT